MMPTHQALPLIVRDVVYKSQDSVLIDKINLEISSNHTSIILGHNGSGKSLLLKLLHGVITPFSGTITWNQMTPSTQQYWRTFLLQRPTFFHQTVLFNIEFVLKVAKTPKSEYKARCEQALEICGLTRLADRNTYSLSGGELQKLSLARAWVLEPSVVLLDEPTVALDPPSVIGFENIIQQFEQSNTKVIMTTHDISQAKRLASEIVFIDKGKILEHSPADKFFSEPQSKQAKNFLGGKLSA